ncbi:hypothetical protein KIW84_070743 [Lathyrus oleraceus]|uniref:Mitochondrial protein n=1 Tax=Pisum sativum TaxID=3888 RepID=A0A9D4VHL9_PEA|nr:hypothetical protein KIW84_070743 [Pisum sativum]
MSDSKPVGNPIVPGTRLSKDEKGTKIDSTMFKQVVGSLMYLTATRPDIMFGEVQFLGHQRSSMWLHYLPLRLSILSRLLAHVNTFGLRGYSENLGIKEKKAA